MKIKLLATLFFMILAKTYSQDAISKIIPPLPETASLIDGYKAQMNGYQGNASFSVPVYTMVEDGMSVPVYLSYSSNSNRVRERASRVGLGWNLFAGGSVSRSIRDIADEGPDGLLSCFKCNEEFYEKREVRKKFLSIIGTGYYNVAKDLEPDLFHFNFLGYSGKFIINNSTYKAIVQETNDLKIDLVFNSNRSELQKIVFTDPEGNKYYFGLNKDNSKESYERIQNASFYSFNTRNSSTIQGNNDNLGGGNFISAWNLLEIELVNKKKITFDYGNQIISHKSISSITEPLEGNGGFEVINYMDIIGRESVLKSIKFSGGEVSFEYDLNNREDLSGSKALKKIKVLDSKNIVVKDYQLEHFYTEHTDRSNVIPVLSLDNTSYKRLHLKNVKKYNKDKGGYEPFYDFEYNSKILPSVHSTSLDLWGYFNNANNRFYLLKSDYVKREVDSIQSRASLLQKVKLPVGGYVEYIYERNSFIKPLEYDSFLIKGLEEKSSKPADIYNTVAMAKMPIYYDSIRNYFSRDFSIETINHVSVEVRFEGPRGCDRAADHSCMYSVEIRDENNNLLHGNFDRGTRTISLANGRYKLLVKPRQRIDLNDFEQGVFSIILRWKKDQRTNEINYTEMVGPGNRLKRINYYDHTGRLEDYMNYSYKGLQQKTSGKIFSIPTYKFIFKSQDGAIYPDIVTATLGNGIVSMFDTNDYGYEYITEYNDIERIRRRYTVFVDEGEYFLYDHHLPIDLSWTRGKLVEEEYYKKDTNQWKLIKQIKNNYQFYNRTSHPFPWSTGNLVSFGRIRPIPPRDLENTNEPLKYSITDKLSIFPLYKFGYFVSTIEELNNRQPTSVDRYRVSYFIGGTMNLIETTVTDYEKEALSYREEFDYSSVKHNQVTEKRRIFADNSAYKSRYTYAPDLSSSAIATQMTNQNILSPLSVEELRGEEKIVLTKNNFSTLGNNAIRLSSVETQKANHALEEQFRINYNQNAKEIETLVHGVKTVYLYGYNQNLVIAKIENASKEEVASALGVSVSNLVTMNETKLSQINTLRTNSTLKEAMITTYEHKPLVGVIKIIDPKGRKSTYEYDGLNRLKAIKDDKGNSIEEYEYNYKQ